MLEKLKEIIPLLSFVSIISAIVGGIYFFGGFMADVKAGQLTPEEKVRTLDHVNGAPTPEQLQRKLILDSINTVHAIKSRRKRDSLGIIRDSINKLNAVQMFQIKEEIKALQKE